MSRGVGIECCRSGELLEELTPPREIRCPGETGTYERDAIPLLDGLSEATHLRRIDVCHMASECRDWMSLGTREI
jgi:hypothetical protein